MLTERSEGGIEVERRPEGAVKRATPTDGRAEHREALRTAERR
jgi:hypothetical protein